MNKKLNILIINWQDIKNPLGGGAEVHLHEIFSRIAQMGHDVTLLACKIPGQPNNETIDGIKVIRYGSRNLFNFHVPSAYKKLSKKNKYDIVIDDINKIPFYTPLFVKEPLLAISHHFFGKSIFREANFLTGAYVYMAENIMSLVYKKTPFAVVSDSTLEEFRSRGYPKKNFTIIYNAIEPGKFPMAVGQKAEIPTITYFGRIKKYKSIDHLFYAFVIAMKKIEGLRLEIIGRGDFLADLERLAQKLMITDKVIFHGFVDESRKIELLSRSHICVNTSMKEGWGITNIESNACGTPVISANVPGLRDSVKEGQSGVLYEYGNISHLADKIVETLSNSEKLQELSDGAVHWANQFSWDNSARQMLDLCYKVIRKHP